MSLVSGELASRKFPLAHSFVDFSRMCFNARVALGWMEETLGKVPTQNDCAQNKKLKSDS
jgi:hypothetical protein